MTRSKLPYVCYSNTPKYQISLRSTIASLIVPFYFKNIFEMLQVEQMTTVMILLFRRSKVPRMHCRFTHGRPALTIFRMFGVMLPLLRDKPLHDIMVTFKPSSQN